MRRVTSLSSSIRFALTVFRGFRTSKSKQTKWARRLLRVPHASDEQIATEVRAAIARSCPNIPDQHIPCVTELISAGIRIARLEGRIQQSEVSTS